MAMGSGQLNFLGQSHERRQARALEKGYAFNTAARIYHGENRASHSEFRTSPERSARVLHTGRARG